MADDLANILLSLNPFVLRPFIGKFTYFDHHGGLNTTVYIYIFLRVYLGLSKTNTIFYQNGEKDEKEEKRTIF